MNTIKYIPIEVSDLMDGEVVVWTKMITYYRPKPCFTVKFKGFEQKQNKFIPPSNKKKYKVYGVNNKPIEKKKSKFVLGESRIVTYNGMKYNLKNEHDFKTLHFNLKVEAALNNLA